MSQSHLFPSLFFPVFPPWTTLPMILHSPSLVPHWSSPSPDSHRHHYLDTIETVTCLILDVYANVVFVLLPDVKQCFVIFLFILILNLKVISIKNFSVCGGPVTTWCLGGIRQQKHSVIVLQV